MSYNQDRTTESWNNDPNNFTNNSGPNVQRNANADGGYQQGGGPGFETQPNQQFTDANPTRDPTDTSTWGSDGRQRNDFGRDTQPRGPDGTQLWSAGPGEKYGNTGIPGNTTDVNTVGAGGDQFERTGFGQGGYRDDRETEGTGGKPSVGQRIKGGVEKMTDRVTGH